MPTENERRYEAARNELKKTHTSDPKHRSLRRELMRAKLACSNERTGRKAR